MNTRYNLMMFDLFSHPNIASIDSFLIQYESIGNMDYPTIRLKGLNNVIECKSLTEIILKSQLIKKRQVERYAP